MRKTDFEAFRLKAARLSIPLVPCLETLKINKITEPAGTTAGYLVIDDLRNINFPATSYENQELCRLTALVLKQTTYAYEQGVSGDQL